MPIGPHEEITERVIKCAFDVQNKLGCGFLEKVYENAMMVALEHEGLKAARQVPLRVHYQGVLVGDYVADIIVERTVLLEIKATEENPPIYVAQVLNYLKATNLPVALLLNFGRPRVYYRRLTLRTRTDGRDAGDTGDEEQPERGHEKDSMAGALALWDFVGPTCA